MDNREKLYFTDKIKKLAKRKPVPEKSEYTAKMLHKDCLIQRKQIPNIKNNIPAKTVFYGIEFLHKGHKYNVFDYETIFPLKTISFCGLSFPCVAKPDIYLSQCFGNYKKLPTKLHFHSLEATFQDEEKIALQEFVEEK
jgi:phosphorylcholine metabolism protein LicD